MTIAYAVLSPSIALGRVLSADLALLLHQGAALSIPRLSHRLLDLERASHLHNEVLRIEASASIRRSLDDY